MSTDRTHEDDISSCRWCGMRGIGFDEAPRPADYCGHDPALLASDQRRMKTLWNADQLPLGTKAFAFNGGHWLKVASGWKWQCVGDVGSTFPTPGADWHGLIELPKGEVLGCNRLGCPEPFSGPCAQCDSRY